MPFYHLINQNCSSQWMRRRKRQQTNQKIAVTPLTSVKTYYQKEYELSNEQILNFAITEFDTLPPPNYFHLINLLNLIRHLTNDIKGQFYGFNNNNTGK